MSPEAGPDQRVGHVLRVTIPVSQHIQLHKLRLLLGKPMSEVVQEALDLYFANHNAETAQRAQDADGADERHA